MKNSIEITNRFTRTLEWDPEPIVQIIGGVNTVALVNPDTVIDTKRKEVIAPESLFLPNIRDDGTLRDLDVLVLSSEASYVSYVSRKVDEAIGKDLDGSVFGIRPESVLHSQIKNAFGVAALKTFLSDRYYVSNETKSFMSPDSAPICGTDNGYQYGIVKSLFPFAAPIHPESLETWTLKVGEIDIPIPNPAMSIINYTNRSISGLRPKDRLKVENMAAIVFEKAPELREWAIKGPGSDQFKLGTIIRSLNPNRPAVNLFGTDYYDRTLTISELAEHETFMLKELGHEQKCRIVGLAALKAQSLSFFESNPTIVTVFQKFLERNLDSIVNNR